ncbi:hypothetical protein DFH08DRAFT_964940 [Mycena albidolilacea]|uniref:CxC2-like cysteine cluster KDZ transposase-associated domain-containing protein n=1 Tax=Mycena albidolilacea TaxID=1033008 RepID=A0AAD6ZSQ9_9AGAR|nr:hypothetical protein DFH08DRAFT_964940 [Mycena albidolilacea]
MVCTNIHVTLPLSAIMKRSLQPGSYTHRKHAKNTFSLASFGHSLQSPSTSGSSSSLSARAGNLTADGRHAAVQALPLQRSQPASRSTSESAPAINLDGDEDWLDVSVDEPPPTATGTSQNRRKRQWMIIFTTGSPTTVTIIYGYSLVAKVLWARNLAACAAGPQNIAAANAMAVSSSAANAWWRLIAFVRCVVLRCAWNGTFFQQRELRQLGLRVQLGHPDNTPCPRAHPGRAKFVVIASNGFHHVLVDFCECRRSGSQLHWEQLLSYGWYPATPDNPQSAVTIATLRLFHSISLQGKTTVYHYFNALAKITNNIGSKTFKRRYQLALRIVHQWRNLRALKRGGMGNDPDRHTAQTREGELAVECIACPKAGVNLPEGWEKAPLEMRFLYTIFLAIDTCFWLKRKKISSWLRDPSLQDGWAYFVRSFLYEDFVKTLGEQTEMSTCTGLAALDHANTKYSQGYAATGCGMITCGRHEIVCKNGVGDLQAGEKYYGNMDYIVASAMRHFVQLLFFLFLYDIMCQWSKNLKERLLKLPPHVRFILAHYFVKFIIPKLHILGHLKFCQDFFSLLFTLGAAQADMEGIKRIWSSSGLMGASTREMGPGLRQDTLDDFWHYWNWNKVVGMGSTLRKRLLKARKELTRQTGALQEFTDAQEGEVSAWRKAVDDFETGASTANPYELPHASPMLRDIEMELVREEQERERNPTAVREATDDMMIEYLMLGVEIEGQQRQLSADLLAKKNPTTKELTDFVTRHTRISRQIKKLRIMQRKHSPGALQCLATAADPAEPPEAEHAPLFPPSGLSPLQAMPPLSVPDVAIAEARLRDAQCSESLEVIRHGLIVKRRLQTYKMLHSRRQHQNTRSRTLVDGQQWKIDLAAATYRHARTARLALVHAAGACSWRALKKADLRLPEDEEEAKRRKQRAMKGKRKEVQQVNENGRRRASPRGFGTPPGGWRGVVGEAMHEGVRVEWSKAYTRVKRWREEVRLLQEEMVRCLLTLEWQAVQWNQRATPDHYTGQIAYSATHAQGAMALVARVAAVRWKLTSRFRCLWCKVSDRMAGEDGVSSSGSGSDSDSDDSGDEGAWTDEQEELGLPAPEQPENEACAPEGEEGEPEGDGSEGGDMEEDDGGDVERRRNEMDKLLAIRTTSLTQYDEL